MGNIKENHPVVVKLSRVPEALAFKGPAPKIPEKALAVLCSQFAIILSSGLPIVRTVELIASQTEDKALQKILRQTAADVAGGFTLAQALRSSGPALPATFIETVASGEASATLDTAFRRLERHYDKASKTKSKVRSAMIYPAFTLAVAAVVIVIIMVMAVPAFTGNFASMGVELPGITRALIAMSSFFGRFWLLLAIVALGAFLGYRYFKGTPRGRLLHSRLGLSLPVLGKIAYMNGAAQFANSLTTLLASGLSMMRSAQVAATVLDNAWLSDTVQQQLAGLSSGSTLSHCLSLSEAFPELLREMIQVGEETGTLEEVLSVVGEYYENETQVATQRALTLMEPVITLFLGLIVGSILLAVYLPILSMYQGF